MVKSAVTIYFQCEVLNPNAKRQTKHVLKGQISEVISLFWSILNFGILPWLTTDNFNQGETSQTRKGQRDNH